MDRHSETDAIIGLQDLVTMVACMNGAYAIFFERALTADGRLARRNRQRLFHVLSRVMPTGTEVELCVAGPCLES